MTIEAISIMLYLSVICSPCTYLQEEIESIEIENQETINQIKNEPDYLDQIIDDYWDIAHEVIIIEKIEDY